MKRIKYYLRRIFSVDLTSLGFFRIGLGLVLIFDLAYRTTSFTAHYSSKGVLPLSLLSEFKNSQYLWGLFFFDGSLLFQGIIFLCGFLFAVLLIVGFCSRTMAFLSWFILLSIHNRNPLLVSFGDNALLLFLFWSIFLPIGARLSLDAYGRRNSPKYVNSYISFGSVVIISQVLILFLTNVILKSKHVWLTEGSAFYYAYNLDFFLSESGIQKAKFFINHSKLFSNFIWYWELIGTILLVIPFGFPGFRVLGILGFLVIQIVYAGTMNIGIYPYIIMVSLLLFVPTQTWKILEVNTDKSVGIQATSGNLFTKILLGFFIVCSLNRILVARNIKRPFPAFLEVTSGYLHLDQNWSMLAPFPSQDDGWFSIVVRNSSADEIEWLTSVSTQNLKQTTKPENINETFRTPQWALYFWNLKSIGGFGLKEHLAQFICHDWNTKKTKRQPINQVSIYYYYEPTPKFKLAATPNARPVLLHQADCPQLSKP